ncbi:helix-turn-helix domain-containing protein [Streptomyces sp. NPDC048057]|uniref:helix-turn-helix domain-containing protein n=1 Tax=Streptomyces sp. NPDC048057 TaxID=3155628 RepID=UPI00340E723D
MPNQRLRAALAAGGWTYATLAKTVGIDPKSVERWVNLDRTPRRTTAALAADALGESAYALWPALRQTRTARANSPELVAFYERRSDLPVSAFVDLMVQARERIDVLVYSGFWLTEDSTFHRVVGEKSAAGVQIRFLLGNPGSDAVAVRGADEGIGAALAGKIQNALVNYRSFFGLPGVEFRLHATTLYNSIYRADDEMFANGHLYGMGAYLAPVLHLQRVSGGGMFDSYAESIDRVWESARPISSPTDLGGLQT